MDGKLFMTALMLIGTLISSIVTLGLSVVSPGPSANPSFRSGRRISVVRNEIDITKLNFMRTFGEIDILHKTVKTPEFPLFPDCSHMILGQVPFLKNIRNTNT